MIQSLTFVFLCPQNPIQISLPIIAIYIRHYISGSFFYGSNLIIYQLDLYLYHSNPYSEALLHTYANTHLPILIKIQLYNLLQILIKYRFERSNPLGKFWFIHLRNDIFLILATTCENPFTLLAKSGCSCIRIPGKKRIIYQTFRVYSIFL